VWVTTPAMTKHILELLGINVATHSGLVLLAYGSAFTGSSPASRSLSIASCGLSATLLFKALITLEGLGRQYDLVVGMRRRRAESRCQS